MRTCSAPAASPLANAALASSMQFLTGSILTAGPAEREAVDIFLAVSCSRSMQTQHGLAPVFQSVVAVCSCFPALFAWRRLGALCGMPNRP